MAHTVTRIEGFEGGTLVSSINGQGGTAPTIVTSPIRTGTYALRINAASGASSFALLRNRFTTLAEQDSTDLVAVVERIYFRTASLPSVTTAFFSFLNDASAMKLRIDLNPDGTIRLFNGVTGVNGTTALVRNTWYRIEARYISGVERVIRINGLTEVMDTGGGNTGGVSQTLLGRNAVDTTVIDFFYDDILIETDATASNIDYPGYGVVRRLDITGNGTDAPGTWTTSPVGVEPWTVVDGQEDVDTSTMLSPATSSSHTFTVQTADQAGLELAPMAAQLTDMLRANGVDTAVYRLRLRSGSTINETLDASAQTGTAGQPYRMQVKVYQTDPNTGIAWTRTGVAAAQPGLQYRTSNIQLRCTCVIWQVAEPVPDSQPAGGSVLERFELVTGVLRSVTNYDPLIRTVRLTSEALNRPNEAINVVAVNLRYVPYGRGTLSGNWRFEEQTTRAISLPPNPLSFSNLGTNGASTFIFGSSTMTRGDEVYVRHVPIDGTGKFFELELRQSGSRGWDLLGIDFEIQPEGRREAFVDGEF